MAAFSGGAPEAMALVREPLPIVGGHILPPTKPVLGVEVDEAACAARPPDFAHDGRRTKLYYGAFHADGSVADS